jgi:hypothetical protein
MSVIANFRLRFCIAILLFGGLFYALQDDVPTFLTAAIPTVTTFLINDISYKKEVKQKQADKLKEYLEISSREEETEEKPNRETETNLIITEPSSASSKQSTATLQKSPADKVYANLLSLGVVDEEQYKYLVKKQK